MSKLDLLVKRLSGDFSNNFVSLNSLLTIEQASSHSDLPLFNQQPTDGKFRPSFFLSLSIIHPIPVPHNMEEKSYRYFCFIATFKFLPNVDKTIIICMLWLTANNGQYKRSVFCPNKLIIGG